MPRKSQQFRPIGVQSQLAGSFPSPFSDSVRSYIQQLGIPPGDYQDPTFLPVGSAVADPRAGLLPPSVGAPITHVFQSATPGVQRQLDRMLGGGPAAIYDPRAYSSGVPFTARDGTRINPSYFDRVEQNQSAEGAVGADGNFVDPATGLSYTRDEAGNIRSLLAQQKGKEALLQNALSGAGNVDVSQFASNIQ